MKLYRFQEIKYAAPLDEYECPIGRGRVEVILREFEVIKRTSCGAWIEDFGGRKKFVNLKARKKYACETIEEAEASFRARKRAQLRIYASRSQDIVEALNLLDLKKYTVM